MTVPDPAPDSASALAPPTDPARLVADLVTLLRLEQIDADRFIGQSEDIGTPRVFGGQVLGQSLMAACRTVGADRPVHSLHAYFLLPGDKNESIDYLVDRVRDGRSFTTRRVVAQQKGRTIFTMMASFQTVEPGAFSHQLTMPEAPAPETLVSDAELRRALGNRAPAGMNDKFLLERPIEFRTVDPPDLLTPELRPAEALVWMRALTELPDDPALHCALLAYASDHGLLRAALLPHGLSFMQGRLRPASLDHAMWFHRDFRLDDWLLYAIDSPSGGGARGLCRGEIFSRDGRLVASVAQEGMLRVVDAGTPVG
ncbi:acyl-CoA thioesterase II [Variovorax sp. PAMC28562]|uniref:acyl-CoA thioesterase II n=1 Tax=Variovorax sp. PAMC28562 TaxID=2762323 RepID=UPI00164D7094|nr:acyl-CoA thioesterase II [Variovorax sp. PAMC28562]QNK74446.1 acyl-CoA thioesterase II [Variovorax sp. PAMC28562]